MKNCAYCGQQFMVFHMCTGKGDDMPKKSGYPGGSKKKGSMSTPKVKKGKTRKTTRKSK